MLYQDDNTREILRQGAVLQEKNKICVVGIKFSQVGLGLTIFFFGSGVVFSQKNNHISGVGIKHFDFVLVSTHH